MIIVNRQKFLKLPTNTLYSKYEPCVMRPLEIKGETTSTGDFITQEINDAIDCNDTCDMVIKLASAEHGKHVGFDFDCEGRDGCYDEDQLFAVWNKKDVAMLIDRLKMCL